MKTLIRLSTLLAFAGILGLAATWHPHTHAQNLTTPPAIPVQVFSNKNLAGSVAVTASTLTIIDSQSVTMPSSGCPCRVFVSYTYSFANGGSAFASFVTDGTQLFGQYNSNVANSLFSGAAWSPVTYANGAIVTFTVKFQDGSTATVNTTNSLGAPSNLQLAVVASN
jgi:hypothetical protein